MISTIALFAALGGGYAMAFVGSGQLQKGAATNVGTSFQTVRSLDGIGSIQARCVTNVLTIKFHNSTANTLRVDRQRSNFDGTTYSAGTVAAGGDNDVMNINGVHEFRETFRYHIHRDDSGGDQTAHKSPQAEIQVSIEQNGACGFTSVHVLVLNTQES